jgi:hypothetical protein
MKDGKRPEGYGESQKLNQPPQETKKPATQESGFLLGDEIKHAGEAIRQPRLRAVLDLL